jgi:E3 ubiquitin-protein ligase UHRF1
VCRCDDSDPIDVSASHIRPRARHRIALENVEIGSRVFVNYNYDEPAARGYWYDAIVTKKRVTRTIKELYATVFIG